MTTSHHSPKAPRGALPLQARDVAALAHVSRAHRALAAEKLWPALAAATLAAAEGSEARWELAWLPRCRVKNSVPFVGVEFRGGRFVRREPPAAAPRCVYDECLRLKGLGIGLAYVKPQFGLEDEDLGEATLYPGGSSQNIYYRTPSPFGQSYVLRLGTVVRLARAKHSTAAALDAALREQRVAAAAELLAGNGVEPSSRMARLKVTAACPSLAAAIAPGGADRKKKTSLLDPCAPCSLRWRPAAWA